MQFRTNSGVVLALLLLTLICLDTGRVNALPGYLETTKTTYNFKPDGVIASKSCNLCHAGVTNAKSLNAFGKDLQSALKSSGGQQVTAELLHSLDSKDSDGDGFPNGDEFKADTLPGDPASKPAGLPPNTVKPAAGNSSSEFNPFSIQQLLYPESAQHPVFVHFPIALFIFSLVFDCIGIWKKNTALLAAGYVNLIAAAITGIASVITGLLAWRFGYGGVALSENKWLLFHLVLGVTTTVLICFLWFVRSRHPKNAARPLSNLYFVLGILALMTITLTGHLGGVVSGVVHP